MSFQDSIELSEIPKGWCNSAFAAMHAGGPSFVLQNFKVFSLASTLHKVMKGPIRAYTLQCLTEHSFFGLMKNTSYFTDQLCFLDKFHKRVNEGKQTKVLS